MIWLHTLIIIMIIGFSFTSDNFLTKALLVELLFPKSKTAVNCTCLIKRAMYNDCAWVVNRVSF